MLNKLNQLSFVIGLFFILVAAILIVGYVMGGELKTPINLYSGIGMFLFGIFMVLIKENEEPNS
jgi:predicted membrane channel-forming protein YqfA (hemolysin III family)